MKKDIKFVADKESIQIYKESLTETIQQLLDEDKSGTLTVQTILMKLKSGEL